MDRADAGTRTQTPKARVATGEVGANKKPESPEAFIEAVRERLVKRGVGRMWAEALVDSDREWLAAHWLDVSIDKASDEVFDPELTDQIGPYRERVALFLERYGIDTAQAESLLDRRGHDLKEAMNARLPPWGVAAQLVTHAEGRRAETLEAQRDGGLWVRLTPQVVAFLAQAAGLGLLGSTAETVAETLVQRGLMDLMRDGFLEKTAGARG